MSMFLRRFFMELQREKVVVNQYHLDARSKKYEKENGIPKTKLRVNFKVLNQDEANDSSEILSYLTFTIVLQSFVISGTISQKSTVYLSSVATPEEFPDEDRRQLAEPLLDTLRRMTYEVTEIAFDAPGIELEF